MLESLSLGSYLLLVDYTSRLFRTGKANLNAGVAEVFERLESNVEVWNDRIRQMLSCRELRENRRKPNGARQRQTRIVVAC